MESMNLTAECLPCRIFYNWDDFPKADPVSMHADPALIASAATTGYSAEVYLLEDLKKRRKDSH
ncbi:hypothetical protein DDZ15_02400 [Rhodohalobacter mucosus]|uniref:Uncharacterized protein n=2 Tax=Rhodohalobacter mucosus TaxID=2079485 RepID=A0A316TTX0_9BACT|nr:hypothetical protein DDZ15_02400 [Rhodohalobacter mucosus]